MATALKVEEISGRTGEDTIAVGSTTGTRVRMYRVYFDVLDATENDAVSASAGGVSIPYLWTALGTGTYETMYMLLNVRGEHDKNDPSVWTITCNYSIPAPGQNKPAAGSAKFNISINGTSVVHEEEVLQDGNGKPIRNTSKVAYSPSLKQDVYNERITVSYDTYSPDWATLKACRGHSNDAAITMTINGHPRVFAINTLKLDATEWSGTVDYTGAGAIKVTLHLLEKPSNMIGGVEWGTWTTHVVDMGYHYLKAGKPAKILESMIDPTLPNVPVTMIQYLNGSGQLLADGAVAVQVPGGFAMTTPVSFTTLLADILT